MPSVLEVDSLSRQFGSHQGVRIPDLRLEPGEILGLLGPNGAGKTTCLRMLAGVLAPATGCIRISGIDLLAAPRRAKRHLGYLPERPPIAPELKVRAYLEYRGLLQGLRGAVLRDAVASVMTECGIESVARRLLGHLSKGYRQRVGLAGILLHNPDLLLLDEPGDGLDPHQAHELRALIRRRAARGRAAIFSSHRLDEVRSLCTSVLVLNQGQIRYQGKLRLPGEANHDGPLRVRLVPPSTPQALMALAPVARAEVIGDGFMRLHLQPGSSAIELSRALFEHGFGLAEFCPEPGDLERLFLDGFGAADHGDQAS